MSQNYFDYISGWSPQKLFGYLYSSLGTEFQPELLPRTSKSELARILRNDFSRRAIASSGPESLSELLTWTNREDGNSEVYQRLCRGLSIILGGFLPEKEALGQRQLRILKNTIELCLDYDVPDSNDIFWRMLDTGSYKGVKLNGREIRDSIMKATFKTKDSRNTAKHWKQLFLCEEAEGPKITAMQHAYHLDLQVGLEVLKALVDFWQAGQVRNKVAASFVGVYFFDLGSNHPREYINIATQLRNYWEWRLGDDNLGEIWKVIAPLDSMKGLLMFNRPAWELEFTDGEALRKPEGYVQYCQNMRALYGGQIPLL